MICATPSSLVRVCVRPAGVVRAVAQVTAAGEGVGRVVEGRTVAVKVAVVEAAATEAVARMAAGKVVVERKGGDSLHGRAYGSIFFSSGERYPRTPRQWVPGKGYEISKLVLECDYEQEDDREL